MLKFSVALAAAALIAGAAAAAGDDHDHKHDHDHAGDHRELGAHVHGEGVLRIAIEGHHLEASLESPGMDIVGFEHHPEGAEEIAAANAAFAKLSDPMTLLGVPLAAACHLSSVMVELEFEGEDHDHDHDHKGEMAEHDHAHEDGARHSAFHAEYKLHCHEIAQLDALNPVYFDSFPGGEKLDVTLLSDKGQSAMEVDKSAPRIALK